MSLVTYGDLTQEDFKDPQLVRVNEVMRHLIEQVNRLAGLGGTITLQDDLDLAGHRIINLGKATADTDAVSASYADSNYGPDVIRKRMEAYGNKALQTVRRLNDQDQREQYSTFLNDTASTPPNTNTSIISVVAAGANSTITVSAGTMPYADGTTLSYAGRIDTVANPGVGSYFFFYYVRVSDSTLQYIGPFTSNTSANQILANSDGRSFVGTAQVNVGGGGTGGGGSDPVGGGGCTEVGTALEFYPDSRPSMTIEQCDEWYCFQLSSGEIVKCAKNTLVSVFIRVQELDFSDMVEKKNGKIGTVLKHWVERRPSHKQVVKEPEHGTYFANGARLHNTKVIS